MPTTKLPTSVQVGQGQIPAGVIPASSVLDNVTQVAADGVVSAVSLDDAYNKNPIPTLTGTGGAGSGRQVLLTNGPLALTRDISTASQKQTYRWRSALETADQAGGQTSWGGTLVPGNSTSWQSGGGSWGLVREVPWRGANTDYQLNLSTQNGPSVVEMTLNSFSQPDLTDINATALTFIKDTAGALLNPGAAGTYLVRCAPGQYFKLTSPAASYQSSIRKYLDIVQVQYTDGTFASFVITDVLANGTDVEVTGMDGTRPYFYSNTACKLRVYQPTLLAGGSINHNLAARDEQMWARPLVVAAGPQTTSDTHYAYEALCPLFVAARPDGESLVLGCYDAAAADSRVRHTLNFYGDGGFTASGGAQTVNILSRNGVPSYYTDASSINRGFDLSEGSLHHLVWTGNASLGQNFVLTIDSVWRDAYHSILTRAGDEWIVVIERDQGVTAGNFTVTWPMTVKFEGSDAVVPPNSNFKAVYRFLHDYTGITATRALFS